LASSFSISACSRSASPGRVPCSQTSQELGSRGYGVIGQDDIRRIQEELGRLAIDAARIDVDGFIEASELVGSPQVVHGINPRAVTSSGEWAEMARLLKPFPDHVVERLFMIRRELAKGDEDSVPEEAA
jgi:hypothetical protein